MIDPSRSLRDLSFFASLRGDTLEKLARMVHSRRYVPGQLIALEGEPCQALYVVGQGLVRTRRMSLEGREQVLAYYGPGQAFNLVSAVDGGATQATADAVTDATLHIIPCTRFRQLLQGHPDLASVALGQLAADSRRLSDMVEDLALHTVRTRLARFLLSETSEQPSGNRWTQEEIATHIGTVREMVGRTLRSFASEGLIRRERGRIVVVDRQALQREADR